MLIVRKKQEITLSSLQAYFVISHSSGEILIKLACENGKDPGRTGAYQSTNLEVVGSSPTRVIFILHFHSPFSFSTIFHSKFLLLLKIYSSQGWFKVASLLNSIINLIIISEHCSLKSKLPVADT